VPSIFDGIDNCSIPVHPFKRLSHIFIELNTLKELVQYPVQENSRLMIKYEGVKGFFFRHDAIPWTIYLYLA